jgi:hypothetical protein
MQNVRTAMGRFFKPGTREISSPDDDATRLVERDTRLDSLRGLALVIMTIDHMQGNFKQFTYQALGFITAAELFIFLSGLVAGIVYTKRYERDSFSSIRSQCWKRAAKLYFYHIAMFASVIAIGHMSATMSLAWQAWIPHLKNALILESPLRAMSLGGLLLYQPTHLDILPMYALFLLFIPFAVFVLIRWGSLPVFIVSASGWLAARKGHSYKKMNEYLEPLELHAPYFDIVAWQFLFCLGLIFGCARALSRPWLSTLIRWGWLPALGMTMACLALRYDLISTQWALSVFDLREATRIPWLGWFRLMNFLCLALAVAGLASRWPTRFQWPWFSLLGRHSLQVFTAHIAIVFLSAPLCGWIAGNDAFHWEVALMVFVMSLITLTAVLHQGWLNDRKPSTL